ncbi:MAG: LmbE family protein [Thermomicrobiales bacterium]|jgi:LmbE family N-acetylglucosaminyl deacetylase|nr:LmbE family protein [Thermomicrobiales bacterium]MCD6058270.1 LmbE family protein [Thermomicrobiales bacterium]
MSSTSDVPPLLTRPARQLFLSPHYDDVPLSAGATVRLLADRGLAPETLVVFGSEPDRDRPLSAFAEAMHEKWGLTGDEVIASRQAEEAAAAAELGAQTRVLPFRDAIYRGDAYLSDEDLFGSPATEEASLPNAIAAALDLADSPDATTRIYAPLGIGKHVDHQIVHMAGQELSGKGWDVWFYEDIPYALRPMALDTRLAEIGGTQFAPVARVPAESTWERKIDAILRYPSQLETVFLQYVGVGTTREEISEALSAYAAGVGDGAMAERFWRLSDAPAAAGS